MRAAYGRAWRMRSCARRILLAATISIALVIFCVLLTLAILERISLVPGMASVRPGRLKGFADFLERRLVRLELRLGIDRRQIRRMGAAGEGLQRRLEGDDLRPLDLIHVAVVDRID